MDSSSSSRQDSLWLQSTRRSTRSASNQEKEAKEKAMLNEATKNQEQASESSETKKKDSSGSWHIVRGSNNEVVEYVTKEGESYKLLDSAYVETERSDHPYSIITIQEMKVSKKDNAVVLVKWYYRPSEVPDSVYQMLVKDRLDGIDDEAEKESVLKKETRNRELFISEDDILESFPVSRLRGKCTVKHFTSMEEVKGYNLKPDTFFYLLGYNPETRRLTSPQGEVRVGPSHQWTASTRGIFYKAAIPDLLPPLPPSTKQVNEEYEELTWEPKVNDCDLIMYLRSARSMAAFAGMYDGGSPEEGYVIASRDETTINALNVLFQCKGDARAAIQCLVKKPLPITIERKWTEDQVKRFQKGLRQNGKNFYKIKKDQLPSKETAELVEFYYLWKKVQDNLVVQPQSKSRRQASLKRNAKTSTPQPEAGDGSSSDIESSAEESEKEQEHVCQHCSTTTSEDWIVGGKEEVMLCTKCRILFKKYGEEAQLKIDFNSKTPSDFDEADSGASLSLFNSSVSEKVPPPFMFKPIKEKLHGETLEPMSTENDSNEGPEMKKTIKRQWQSKEEILNEEDPVQEKKMKTEEKIAGQPKNAEESTDAAGEKPSSDKPEEISKQVKMEKSVERPPFVGASIPMSSFLAAGYPPYGPYPMAYPGAPPFAPNAAFTQEIKKEVNSSAAKEESESSNKKEGSSKEKEHPLKTEPPHQSAYPLPLRGPFYPSTPIIPARLPQPGNPRFPASPHLYAWSSVPKSGGDTPASTSSSSSISGKPPQEERTEAPSIPPDEERRSAIPTSSGPRTPDDVVPSSAQVAVPPHPVAGKTTTADNAVTSSDATNTSQQSSVPQAADTGRSKATDSGRDSPDVICTSDDPVLPIYPEHHATIPRGQNWPLGFKFYEDGLPRFEKTKDPVVAFKGKKVRLSSYPGFLCSRTDFAFIPPKLTVKQEVKQQPRQQIPSKPQPSRVPVEKERESLKQRPKPDTPHVSEPIQVKREPSRSYSSHFRPPIGPHPSHVMPHSGRRSTPTHTSTPSSISEATKHLPSHSSPYGGLGPSTPALETLRQYASIDSQREAMSSILAPAQSQYPFHVAQSERDLRERELRERELRERMTKPGMTHSKLLESLDPHTAAAAQAMAMHGMHPSVVHGLLNQHQALEQMRQVYPAAMVGVPGAPQVVPGTIPGFPQVLAANPESLQNAAEMERIAAERLHAERAALEHQYRMELLHNHQHSHVHSHVHLHPQNPPPPGSSVIPPTVTPNEAMLNPYAVMALQAQSQALASLDPVQAAASMNQMLGLSGVRAPAAIMPPPGLPMGHHVLPGRPADPSLLLSATQQLQAVAHDNYMEQQHRAVQAQQAQDYMMRMGYPPKP